MARNEPSVVLWTTGPQSAEVVLVPSSCFLDFAVEYWFGWHATEPGFAGDIGAIEVGLINWLFDWRLHWLMEQ